MGAPLQNTFLLVHECAKRLDDIEQEVRLHFVELSDWARPKLAVRTQR